MTEIEEAAAMSLNYRNQMTITKLLDPPTAIKDAVKDRFASCHEPNVETQRHRISRRHSNELLHAPYREQASNPEDRDEKSRSKVSRRLSNFEPRSGLVRRLSTETLTAPVRATSPTKPTPRARRNSPTANPTASPTGLVEIHQTRQHYLPYQGPVQLPTRSYSPDKVSRGVKRYHSAPLATLQGLRKPVRSISPSSLSPEESETDVAARFKGLTMFDVPLCKGNNNNPSLPTRAGSLSPPVSPWLASLASSSQQRSPASLPVKPPRRQLSPPHSVHLQSK